MNLQTAKTYVYIDVSNIRYACRRSCKFDIDFGKLYQYLERKYPNLQDVRYYEGVSPTDEKRKEHFDFLAREIGYTVCPLWRKTYIQPPQYTFYDCKKCGFLNRVKIHSKSIKLKSNVDVYLASDMLECVAKASEPIHIIILSCDGDYAEAVKAALRINPNSRVTILATPMTKRNNCLSVRLMQLASELDRDNYRLAKIDTIKKHIATSE